MNVNIRLVFNCILAFPLISIICFFVFNTTLISTKAKAKNAPNKYEKSIFSINNREYIKEICSTTKMKWRHRVAFFLMSFYSSNDNSHLLELFSSLEKHFCTDKSNIVYVHYFLFSTNVTQLQENIHLNMKPLSRDYTILQYHGENISRQAFFI